MTVFEAILAPVMPVLRQIEEKRSKHFNETFLWIDFVRILVFYFTERCGSRNSLVVALETADPALQLPAIPAMTISDAFRRFSPDLLRQAYTYLVSVIDIPANPELALIGQVSAVDGSDFPIVGGMILPKSQDVIQHVKLHLEFDLNHMIAANFVVTIRDTSERTAMRKMLQKGITYILDRGYMAFDLLRDIIRAQAYVVMRAYHNIVVETVTELPIVLPTAVQTHWHGVRDRIVQSAHPDAAGILFRLVELTIGPTTYRLITNRFDLTTFQIILLYAYRWQIELILRCFKHTLHGVDVITRDEQGMENFFAAMFLTALLHLYFKVDCLEQGGYHPPTGNDEEVDDQAIQAQISTDTTRTTVHLAIARFMSRINQNLALFWKIPKHWLEMVAAYLHRPFTRSTVDIFNQRALDYYKGP